MKIEELLFNFHEFVLSIELVWILDFKYILLLLLLILSYVVYIVLN